MSEPLATLVAMSGEAARWGGGSGDGAAPVVEIRRSARRRRTVSARREGETVVVLMPAGLSAQQESELVAEMIEKLERADRRSARRSARSDDELVRRTTELSVQWLDGRARPSSVRWVPPMRTRWASCTPSNRTIRVSELLRGVPPYVLDYVLVHELAHLLVPGGHTPQFWEQVRRYPRTERALGYLEAYAAVSRLPAAGPDVDSVSDLDDPDALPGWDGDCEATA